MSMFSAMDSVFAALLASFPVEFREALEQSELTSPQVLMGYPVSSQAQLGLADTRRQHPQDAHACDRGGQDLRRLWERCLLLLPIQLRDALVLAELSSPSVLMGIGSFPLMVPIDSSLSSSPTFSVFPSPVSSFVFVVCAWELCSYDQIVDSG